MIETVPLSAQQEAFLQWMRGSSQLRNPAPVCVALRIRDKFSACVFEQVLQQLTLRHEALRMVFPAQHGGNRGEILELSPPEVRCYVAEGMDLVQRVAFAQDLAYREREREFDLEHGPLLRAVVIELAPDNQVLLLAFHHLIFDGWSMDVMLRELATVYSLFVAGDSSSWSSPQPMQCSEVVRLSRRLWPSNRSAWSRALAGAPAGLYDFRGRKPTNQFAPRLFPFRILADPARNVRRVARVNHATTFMAMLAAWAATLSEWSGVSDMVVISPVAGRTFPGSHAAVGCLFFNVLIRLDTSDNPTFSELLRRVRSSTTAAWSRQDYPFAEFRDDFADSPYLSYYTSRVPLHFPGLESESFILSPQLAQLVKEDLEVPQLRIIDSQIHEISAALVFNQEAFDESTITELANTFVTRLANGCAEYAK